MELKMNQWEGNSERCSTNLTQRDRRVHQHISLGYVEINVYVNSDIEDITIVATWDEFEEPMPGPTQSEPDHQ